MPGDDNKSLLTITKQFSIPTFKMNECMTEDYEDWSGCRSIPRAKRRRKQGHRQNVVTRTRPSSEFWHDKNSNTIYCHPETYNKMHEHINRALQKTQKKVENDFYKMITGR